MFPSREWSPCDRVSSGSSKKVKINNTTMAKVGGACDLSTGVNYGKGGFFLIKFWVCGQ